jgi:hypothetical protein
MVSHLYESICLLIVRAVTLIIVNTKQGMKREEVIEIELEEESTLPSREEMTDH